MALVFASRSVLLSTILCVVVLINSEAMHSNLGTSAAGERSAYDILGDYNFPAGILPIGVNGYDLDVTTGRFAAYFNKTCSFSLEGSYQLEYKSTIGGVISENRLKNLQGVKVKLLFVWVDIVEVSRRGDDLQFSVGIAGCYEKGIELVRGIEMKGKFDWNMSGSQGNPISTKREPNSIDITRKLRQVALNSKIS